MANFCSRCGKQNGDGQAFCVGCGQKIIAVSGPTTGSFNSGNPVGEYSNPGTGYAGAGSSAMAMGKQKLETLKEYSKKDPKKFALIIAGIALLIVLIFGFANKNKILLKGKWDCNGELVTISSDSVVWGSNYVRINELTNDGFTGIFDGDMLYATYQVDSKQLCMTMSCDGWTRTYVCTRIK